MNDPGEVTRLLTALSEGDRSALDRLAPIVYARLRRMAHRQLDGERTGITLATTDLVHEAYLKLVRLDRLRWRDRAHFFAVAAGAMRRILVDHAAQRNAQKRGGGRHTLPLDDNLAALPVAAARPEEVLALDEALARLAEVSPRQSQVVECRYFAGMSIEETAEALRVAPATVKRDWTVARAWLHRELSR
ncbi:MAG TPA: sigma-70 family RNA polymerase sigma factor [Gemmatimonadales bacterium]|jgi:RNA polymerase sigma factor (TIGR02999 family)|nr:sigma-70 family RNA polymerase sigma factor [Gemmatimonadales bacterium]